MCAATNDLVEISFVSLRALRGAQTFSTTKSTKGHEEPNRKYNHCETRHYPYCLRQSTCLDARRPIDTSNDRIPGWATGGTLHDVTLDIWATGRPENKRATAGELLHEALWQGHLQTDEQIKAFGAKVELYVQMTDDLARLMPQIIQYEPDTPYKTIRSLLAESVGEGEDFNKHMGPASMQD